MVRRIPPFFFFQASGNPRALHSFPTRRSSDPPYDLGMAAAIAERWLAVPFAHVLGVEHRKFERLLGDGERRQYGQDRKSTRLNSSHRCISYAVFCLKKKTNRTTKP